MKLWTCQCHIPDLNVPGIIEKNLRYFDSKQLEVSSKQLWVAIFIIKRRSCYLSDGIGRFWLVGLVGRETVAVIFFNQRATNDFFFKIHSVNRGHFNHTLLPVVLNYLVKG